MIRDTYFSRIFTKRILTTLILTTLILTNASFTNAFQAPIRNVWKNQRYQQQTFLHFQVPDDNGESNDWITAADNATSKDLKIKQQLLQMDKEEEELLRYYEQLLVDKDDNIFDGRNVVPVVACVVIALAACVVFTSSSTNNNNDAFNSFLDWKDAVAFTAGETVSSSILRGMLFLGELSVVRSIVATSSMENKIPMDEEESTSRMKEGTINNNKSSDNENSIDWDDLSLDLGSWIIYGYLKDDWLGGKLNFLTNSAIESALFGVISALTIRVVIDIAAPLIQNDDNHLAREQDKQHLKETNGFDRYFQSLISAGVLFSVYDYTLHVLPK